MIAVIRSLLIFSLSVYFVCFILNVEINFNDLKSLTGWNLLINFIYDLMTIVIITLLSYLLAAIVLQQILILK
jgi:hypothetical protein